MEKSITYETIEYVGILAKLSLNDEEKENARRDMTEMLGYIDKLSELDTEGVEPMSHVFAEYNVISERNILCESNILSDQNVFSGQNVLRDDVVTNNDCSAELLSCSPESKKGMYVVPKTFE